MTALDYITVANAIAAKYPTLTPPTGYPAIRSATAQIPNRMTAALPRVLVFVDDGELEAVGGSRAGEHRWRAMFFYKRGGDLPRDRNALVRWLPILLDAWSSSMSASGSGWVVPAIRTVGYTLGTLDFAEQVFSGIELRLQLVTRESWLPTP